MKMHRIVIGFALIVMLLPLSLKISSQTQPPPDPSDRYGWLETLRSPKIDAWVAEANKKSEEHLTKIPEYALILTQERERLQRAAADPMARLPVGRSFGNSIMEIQSGTGRTGGLLRYKPWPQFVSGEGTWTGLLDFDKLSKKEGKTWLPGANYNLGEGTSWLVSLPPDNYKCLVYLSPGGSDASIAREMDTRRPDEFVNDGFVLPEARSSAVWVNQDQLLVGTDFGPGTLSAFKTPLSVRLWKRGTPLSEAQVVLSADPGQLAVLVRAISDLKERHYLIERHIDFFKRESWHWLPGQPAVQIPLAPENVVMGLFEGQLLIWLQADLKIDGQTISSGSVVSADLKKTLISGKLSDVAVIYSPTPSQSFQNFFLVDDAVYLFVLEDVSGQLFRVRRAHGVWASQRVPLPGLGTLLFLAGNSHDKELLVAFENLITPPTLYQVFEEGKVQKLRAMPARFDMSNFLVEQRFAVSRDGTRIPYFIARAKDFPFDGTRPVLMTGYGGFNSPFLPRYLGGSACETAVAYLLERGGAFVSANFRGGGEYGPSWHEAGILAHKQNTWDDVAAVAEDLIKSRITAPRHLGISGASHGGLMVGVAMTQHPELFRAVWCEVPGLDMLRYHLLFSSGAMADYGNPDDPKMRPIIQAWSPYHNVKEKSSYPTVFFVTNARDDRVHPAHARKMYAKMQDFGDNVYFYEAGEGGHGYGAGIEGISIRNARMAAFFLSELLEKPSRIARNE